MADIQDGTYDFVGSAISSFRKANQDQLLRFREVATAAASGDLAREDAVRQSDEILQGLGRILAQALQWGIPSLLIAVLALYLQYQAARDDATTSAAILQELRAAQQTNEQLLEEFKRLDAVASRPAPPPQKAVPIPASLMVAPVRPRDHIHSAPNRHERRKADRLKRTKH